MPDEYEVEHGYWAELYIDKAISEQILMNQHAPSERTGTDADEFGDFAVGFSEELPTLDDLEARF